MTSDPDGAEPPAGAVTDASPSVGAGGRLGSHAHGLRRTDRGATAAAWGVAVVAAVAVLGTALGPGLVLGYDMVLTPDQPLLPRSVGIDTQLPRAVPVDAVVALLDDVVPASLLQKVALLGALVLLGAGCGLLAARVARERGGAPAAVVGAAVASAVAVANPFVVQRLVIGHWSLLVACACLPWLVRSVLRLGEGAPRSVPVTVLLLALSAITPTGGVLAALTCAAALVAVRPGRGAVAVPAAAAAAVNAPWWVPGLLHPASREAAGAGAGVAEFALRAESVLGPFVSAAGLGGIWNGEAVTPGRALVPVQLASMAVLALALVGLDRAGRRARTTGGLLAATGFVLALASSVPVVGVPVVEAVVGVVPGSGLLRDAHKWLALVLPVLAVAAGTGAAALAVPARRRSAGHSARPGARAVATTAVALALVVATVPDGFGGVGGRLQPTRYPADWYHIATALGDVPHEDAVLVLPFQPFRQFGWNGDRTLLDPAPRWFAQQVVTEDRLTVGTTTLAGDSAWADRVRPVLDRDGDADRLARTGVDWVLVEKGTPGTVPQGWVAGAEPAHDGPELALFRLPEVGAVEDPPLPPVVPVLVADGAASLVVLAAAALLLRPRARRPGGGRPMLLSGHRGPPGRT